MRHHRRHLGGGNPLIIPNLAIVWFGIAIVGFLLLRYTIFGRNLFVQGTMLIILIDNVGT